MRADRLVATLLVLQSRGRVTAAELAEELEVSVKTARRDLEALSMAGIPVYPQAGRNGGWQLLGGSRTDLSGLTQNEARTLFMVAGPASTATPEAKQALRKLVQALPETFRADAERAASSMVLDPGRWGSPVEAPPEFLAVLRDAVVAGKQIHIRYADRTRAETTRVVHPLGLVDKGSIWYLIANTDKGMRTFRVNRVRSVDVTTDPVDRPADFDLNEAWQNVVTHVEERRSEALAGSTAVIRVHRWAIVALRQSFGPSVKVIGPAEGEADDENGRLDVEVAAKNPVYIAERLAAWSSHVDVLSPPEVREHLVAIGHALIAHHGPG